MGEPGLSRRLVLVLDLDLDLGPGLFGLDPCLRPDPGQLHTGLFACQFQDLYLQVRFRLLWAF